MSKIRNTIKYLLVKSFFLAALFFAFAWSANAAINPMINYQGRLTDNTGTAVANDTYNMRFMLYTVASGGSAIFTETLTGDDAVPVTGGLFSVMIGSTTDITGVDFNQTLYLGVEIGGTNTVTPDWDGEMSPRKIIGSVPSAFVADTLDGFDSTQFLRSDATGTLTGSLTISGNSTTTNATTTNFYSNTASTTSFFGAGLTTCQSNNVLTYNGAGEFGCEADDAGGGSEFAWDTQSWGVSTTTTLGFLNGFISTASSTIDSNLIITGNSTTTNATTTNFFSSTASSTNLFSSLLNVGSNALVVNSSGLVGIGTAAPAHAIEVAGDGKIANSSGRSILTLGDAGAALSGSGVYVARGLYPNLLDDALNLGGFGGFTFSTNDTPNMGGTTTPKVFITSVGNVGIGVTPDTSFKLEVNGTASTTNFFTTNSTSTSATTTNLRVSDYLSIGGAGGRTTIDANGLFIEGGLEVNSGNTVTGSLFTGDLTVQGTNFTGPASSTLNRFTFTNATGSSATTTNFHVTSLFSGAGLSTCNTSVDKLLWDDGVFSCGTDQSSGGGGSDTNWTFFNNSGLRLATTSNQVVLGATSTSTLSKLEVVGGFTVDSATTTNLVATTICLTGDTCVTTWPSGGSSFAYPFSLSGNATSTLTQFNGGLTAYASSTISALTVTNGTTTNATTTNLFSTTASSTNLFSTSGNIGSLTAGVFTSGLINSQTISSTANFTGTLTATGGLTTLSNLLLTGSSTLQNLTFVNATGTSATTTNLFATSGNFDNINVSQYSGYKQAGNTILYASSTNFSTLVGQGAGESLLSDGIRNTALGYEALNSVTSTDDNTAVGYRALFQNSSGSLNTALGTYALIENFTGSSNVAVGYSALRYNQSASSSVAVGYHAGSGTGNYSNQRGVYIGYEAGVSVTTGSDANTFVGYRSGQNNTTGANNTFLGTFVADNVTTGSNNLVIGYNIDAPSATASNQLNIGNLIFGTSIDGTGTTLSTGNIGIGTTTPQWKLQLADSAPQLTLSDSGSITSNHWSFRNAGGNLYIATSSPTTFATSSATALTINQNGNVGIGGEPGTSKLRVNGSVLFDNPNNASTLVISTNNNIRYDASTAQHVFRVNSADKLVIDSGANYVYNDLSVETTDGATTRLFVDVSSGNIGIGTSTPQWRLQLADSAPQLTLSDSSSLTSNHWSFRNSGGVLYLATSSPTTFATSSVSLLALNGNSSSVSINGGTPSNENALVVKGKAQGDNLAIEENNSTKKWGLGVYTQDFRIGEQGVAYRLTILDNTGYVGIGSGHISPQRSLDVFDSSSPQLRLSQDITATDYTDFQTNSSGNLTITPSGGFAGFGTNSPNYTLEVQGTASTTNFYATNSTTTNATTTNSFATTASSTNLFASLLNIGSNALTVNSTGQIGVRTASPFTSSIMSIGVDASSSNSTNAVLMLGTTDLSSPTANGTYIGTNAPSDFTGNFVDYQLNSTRSFAVNYNGEITTLGGGTASLTANSLTLSQPSATVTIGNSGNFGTGSDLVLQAGAGGLGANMDFVTDNTTRARLNNSGFGIGTTTPGYTLDVYGFINTNQYSGYKQAGNTILYASSTNFSTLVGNAAGALLASDGLRNTAIGYQALDVTTTGDDNTAIGYTALSANTTGLNNTAIGSQAMEFNTTGSHNIAIGQRSLRFGSGSSNVSVGVNASNNTTGGSNSALGFNALLDNTTGSFNVAIGTGALQNNQSASNTVAIGYSAASGDADYTNQRGTYIGYEAGDVVTTGSDNNTFVGYQSGVANTTGANNTLFGYASGDNITTGSNNLILGYNIDAPSATASNQLNIGNLIFGTSIDGTGTTLSTGNIGIGTTTPGSKLDVYGFINTNQYSGYKQAGNTILYASSTNWSVFVGRGAGSSVASDGVSNTAVGYDSLTSVTTADDNTAIGYRALRLSTTARNTALGAYVMEDANTGTDNTGIGFGALGNNTSGTFNSALGSLALGANTEGSFNNAFGYTALDSNTAGAVNNAFGNGALSENTTGSRNAAFGGNALFSNTSGEHNVAMGDGASRYNTSAAGTVALGYTAGQGNSSGFSNTGSISIGYRAGLAFQTGSNYNTLLGFAAGNLITTGANNILIGANSDETSNNLTTGSNNISIGYNIALPSATASNQLNIGNIIFGTSIDGSDSTLSSGNIGIGTTTPQWKLQIASALAPQLTLSDAGSITADHWSFRNVGGNFYLATSSPTTFATSTNAALSIDTNGEVTIDNLSIGNSAMTGDAGTIFGPENYEWVLGYESSDNSFRISSSTSFGTNDILTIAKSTGYVGIGTTTPGAKLNVIGALCVDDGTPSCANSARTDGTIYSVATLSASLDLAESYPTKDESLGAGEIVMLDSGNEMFVSRAERDSNMPLVGIVSTNPGFWLGGFNEEIYKDDIKLPIALSGRVPTKVNNEGGNIKAGDLITISSVDGEGKKATSTDYTVGIALEDMNDEQGTIEVFVNLNGPTKSSEIVSLKNRMNTLELNLASASFATSSSTSASLVATVLEAIGATIQDAVTYFKNLVVETLTVGSEEKPSGITLYDTETGDPYCLMIKNGEHVSIEGECGSTEVDEQETSNNEQENREQDNTEGGSDTATTTDEIVEDESDTASTTGGMIGGKGDNIGEQATEDDPAVGEDIDSSQASTEEGNDVPDGEGVGSGIEDQNEPVGQDSDQSSDEQIVEPADDSTNYEPTDDLSDEPEDVAESKGASSEGDTIN